MLFVDILVIVALEKKCLVEIKCSHLICGGVETFCVSLCYQKGLTRASLFLWCV